MKTDEQPADERHAKQSSSLWRTGKLWFAAVTGLGVGVLGGSAYLLLGGEYFFPIPRWAEGVFFTGFVTGYKAYDLGLPEGAAKVVGVVTVGLTYPLIAVLARSVWLAVKQLLNKRRV